jgi:DNA (cytosine-5)-methyltransferase 1
MKFVSLFSGIGGIDIGLSAAGMECCWQVEIDEFATKVLEKHWPDVQRWGDVRTFPPAQDSNVDLVAGGFPCQSVSHAGERKGSQDVERWLWPEMRRVCEVIQPRWVLVENVIGLLSAGHVRGELFGGILRDLAALGYGHVEWHSISAAHCGSPHVRSRVWLLAYASGIRQPGQGQPVDASYPAPIISREAIDALDGRFRQEWEAEPDVGRVADGIPDRLHRLTALGNSVVPQIAQFLGEQIMEYERAILLG